MIDARDDAEAKAKAALIYVAVMLKFGMLCATLFWRHAMLPSWLSFLLLNLPGVIDEFLILVIFVYWVGPYDVAYSMQHFYLTWVQPKAQVRSHASFRGTRKLPRHTRASDDPCFVSATASATCARCPSEMPSLVLPSAAC